MWKRAMMKLKRKIRYPDNWFNISYISLWHFFRKSTAKIGQKMNSLVGTEIDHKARVPWSLS